MKHTHDFLYSVLDLVPIVQGSTAAEALARALELARHAEKWGYHRYWVAEHHNIPGVASAATSVVIGHLASGTSKMRLGSGGIMLPNHAPLVIAEQFGTLEALYPGRIDLGLGRAPGGDQITSRALRRGLGSSGDTFPEDLRELQGYLGKIQPGQKVRAVPGQDSHVPIYLLGSSTFSASLAAETGLPFAFASHFAPELLYQALNIYRTRFKPSVFLDKPHAMVGVNVIAADTDDEATRLFSSLQQVFLNLIRGRPRELQPPVDDIDDAWNPVEAAQVDRMTSCSAVGGSETLRRQLQKLLDATEADELIATAHIFDPQARLRSFEIAADVFQSMNAAAPSPALS
jgi:luciferase family oxidoreductase group 1